ncbi:MAG: RecA-superfamily ATPase involved in signal transduction, partial [candidate division NC10 bacterium]|nr:RecA-superfamily ATPase involved in signal transduction [candidate division NC10 bacterium]
GRPTLICGGAGSGKTLLAMEFIVRGITEFDEPGVFMAFEETAEELIENVASLGFNVKSLIARKKMVIDYVYIERSEIEETGEYDLEGLFVRINSMIEQVGAKRVVLDSIEELFGGLPNEAILRAELRRLFRWLKKKGVTVIITGEQGEKTLTRYGIEEYVSDCVIFLDHRVHNQISTRRLRIVKYRGSKHGTNEYPTLIDEHGLSVLPISSLGLDYAVSTERVSTGVPRLDAMMAGSGYYKGSSILISGTAGSGKTSLAAAFVDSLCRKGKKCMYFSFEESPEQLMRNMRSIGIDLGRWAKRGLLAFHSLRPQLYGLEMHLATMHKLIRDFNPEGVVVDPVTNLTSVGDTDEIKAMLVRVIDFMKSQGITSVYTSLTAGGSAFEQSEVGISSLMDTWLLVRMIESSNERNRLLYVLKSRGIAHSNQMREFQLTDDGIKLVDVYVGPGQVLTGSARLVQEAKDEAQTVLHQQATGRKKRELEREQANLRAQADAIARQLAGIGAEIQLVKKSDAERQHMMTEERKRLAQARKAD